MKEIKISNKTYKQLESARFLAQCDKERNINISQMIYLISKLYLEHGD